MYLFGQAESIVKNSVYLDRIYAQASISEFYAELWDMYHGDSHELINKALDDLHGVNRSNRAEVEKQNKFKQLVTPINILKDIVDKKSMIYKNPPKRDFYWEDDDGNRKLIVDKIDTDKGHTEETHYADAKLIRKLNKIYSRRFCQLIKKTETYTNLFNTTVWKLSYTAGEFNLHLAKPFQSKFVENKNYNELCDEVRFIVSNRNTGTETKVIWEAWDTYYKKVYESNYNDALNSKQEPIEEDLNLFPAEWERIQKERGGNFKDADGENLDFPHIGDIIPPFIAIRNDMPMGSGFTNPPGEDLQISIIKINVLINYLNYLIRTTSAPQKVVINASGTELKLSNNPNSVTMLKGDAIDSNQRDKPEIGQWDSNGSINDVYNTIIGLIKVIYSQYGINTDLISSGNKSTAESKAMDLKGLRDQIEAGIEVAKLNEENIFHSLMTYYNVMVANGEQHKIPHNVYISVDFQENKKTPEEMAIELDSDLERLRHDLVSALDLIMKYNPDLSQTEAETKLEQNRKQNRGSIDVEFPVDGIEGDEDEQLEDERTRADTAS